MAILRCFGGIGPSVRIRLSRQLICARGEMVSALALGASVREGVRVRVSPSALSSSNRKSYFARNGFSFDFGSNYAVQIRLFTLLIFSTLCPDGGIGSHAGFKLQCP